MKGCSGSRVSIALFMEKDYGGLEEGDIRILRSKRVACLKPPEPHSNCRCIGHFTRSRDCRSPTGSPVGNHPLSRLILECNACK